MAAAHNLVASRAQALIGLAFLASLQPVAAQVLAPVEEPIPRIQFDNSMIVEYGPSAMESARAHVPSGATMCSRTDDRPIQFWREAYLSREWSHRCADAISQYRDYKISVRNTTIEDPEKEKEIVDDYATSCLRRLEDVIDSNARFPKERVKTRTLILMTSWPEVSRLVNSIGMLRSGNRICNGALVSGNDKKIFLLTAAHCLGDVHYAPSSGTTNTPNLMRRLQSLYGSLEFENLLGSTFRVVPSAEAVALLDATYDRDRGDVVLIDLSSKSDLPASIGIKFLDDELKPWQPIMIVGVNPFLQGQSSQLVSKNLLSTTSITLDPQCAVLSNVGGKILHNCQTEGQLSGSPMLVIVNQEFRIAGIHTGGDLFSTEICGTNSIRARNRGIALEATPHYK